MRRLLVYVALMLTPLVGHTTGGFAALGYTLGQVEPGKARDHASVSALQFSFGTWLNGQNTLAAEGRVGLGITDDGIRFTDDSRATVEIDRYFGGYLRAQFPDTLPIRPYGLLGVTRVETTESRQQRDRSRSYSDLSLGMGAEATLDHNIFLALEYQRAADRDTEEVSLFSISIGGRF